jgi:4-hydroxy-4-methyl-2-oxoglutarate aldolase
MSMNGAVWTNLGFRAFTKIDRPDPAIVKTLLRFSSCDLSDVMYKAHTMVGLRAAYTPIARVAGPAVTVSVPSGALNTIKYAANLVQPGDVLVVSAQGDTTYALWGGNVSRGLQARGAAALVMDGAVRDVAEIRELAFPVYTRGFATAFREHAVARGEVNVPIACGGIVVNPGDIVLCDEEGIVSIPPGALDEVVKKATALVERLTSIQPVLLRGEVTMIDQITQELRGWGLREVEETYPAPG